MRKILFVEDDADINEACSEFLISQGFVVLSAQAGEEGLKLFEEHKSDIDLILLDIMLPNKSGLDLLMEIRETSLLPVLMLTALADETTKMNAYDNLADGYLVKPFSMALLLKRIEAILKRVSVDKKAPSFIWKTDDVIVDFTSWTVTKNGEQLTTVMPKEIELLRYFYENKNQLLSRKQILDAIWGEAVCIGERAVDNYVKNIRKKLGTQAIITIKGQGYKLEER